MSLNVSQTLDTKIQEVTETFNKIRTDTPNYAVYSKDICPSDGIPITTPEKKTRKNVEYNGMELLSALMLLYPDVHTENVFERIRHIQQFTYETPNVVSTGIPQFTYETPNVVSTGIRQYDSHRLIIKPDDIAQYALDLTHKQNMIPEYIPAFYRDIGVMGVQAKDIVAVYLTGKYQTFPEIIALNSGVDHKTAKADVYIKMPDRIVGLSVKQSQDATKTNYSIHKLLPLTVAEELTQIKRDFLIAKGFPEHDKTKRNEVNQLFYPETPERPTNPYFQRILTEIEANKQTVLEGILGPLFCRNLPYNMFEYDGDRIIQLNIDDESMATARLEHHIPYYYDKKGELRQCAKMFFRLTVGEKIFRAELRWKGNVHAASPQFQIFAEKSQ
jgi:hypothetical protein